MITKENGDVGTSDESEYKGMPPLGDASDDEISSMDGETFMIRKAINAHIK